MKIAIQELFPEGILTTYEDDTKELLPYGSDHLVDLDPNNEIFERRSHDQGRKR